MADGADGVPPAYTGVQPMQGSYPYQGKQQPMQQFAVQEQSVHGFPPTTPQQQPGGQTMIVRVPMPNDYMAFAVIVTFCCCLPLGIVALIKSSEVRQRHSAGDYEGAENASREAKMWSNAGLVTGCVIISIAGVLVVITTIIPIIFAAVAAASIYKDFGY